jgi:hypothetical protein
MELINPRFQTILSTEIVYGKGDMEHELVIKLNDLNVKKYFWVSESGLKQLGIYPELYKSKLLC